MGQYARLLNSLLACLALAFAGSMFIAACDRSPETPATAPTSRRAAGETTIASVVPAATDMLLEMGLRPRLVGISNYEPRSSEREGIARVGDYLTLDWEQISQIRPDILVIAQPKQDVAQNFRERAERLGITLVDVHIDRLEEIYPVIRRLAEVTDSQAAADRLLSQIQSRLSAISARVADQRRVRTLIVLDESAQFTVGPRNFLDDLLTIAGGTNVGANLEKDYPRIDREKLMELDPEAVIQLLPDAPPQVVEAAKRFWSGIPQLNAVRNGRIYIHTDSHLLLPGPRIAEIAEVMAADLHPLTPASGPTTTTR